MAQLIYRVTGLRGKERVSRTFRSTDESPEAASVLATELENARWLRRANSPMMHGGAKWYPSTVWAVALGTEAMA
jgi:hypothetical protein